jgi:hypothetical protein
MNLTANMETDKPTDNSLEQTESKKAISSQIRTRSNQATNHNTNTTKNEEPPTTEICRTEGTERWTKLELRWRLWLNQNPPKAAKDGGDYSVNEEICRVETPTTPPVGMTSEPKPMGHTRTRVNG